MKQDIKEKKEKRRSKNGQIKLTKLDSNNSTQMNLVKSHTEGEE